MRTWEHGLTLCFVWFIPQLLYIYRQRICIWCLLMISQSHEGYKKNGPNHKLNIKKERKNMKVWESKLEFCPTKTLEYKWLAWIWIVANTRVEVAAHSCSCWSPSTPMMFNAKLFHMLKFKLWSAKGNHHWIKNYRRRGEENEPLTSTSRPKDQIIPQRQR
jgi:hypothetical protein